MRSLCIPSPRRAPSGDELNELPRGTYMFTRVYQVVGPVVLRKVTPRVVLTNQGSTLSRQVGSQKFEFVCERIPSKVAPRVLFRPRS